MNAKRWAPTTEEVKAAFVGHIAKRVATVDAEYGFDRWFKEEVAKAIKAKEDDKDVLMVDLFSRFQIAVEGFPASISVLKSLLIPLAIVKSIRVWSKATQEYTTQLNHTKIKEIRNG